MEMFYECFGIVMQIDGSQKKKFVSITIKFMNALNEFSLVSQQTILIDYIGGLILILKMFSINNYGNSNECPFICSVR